MIGIVFGGIAVAALCAGLVVAARILFDAEQFATTEVSPLVVTPARLPNYYVTQSDTGRWLVQECGTHKVVNSTLSRQLAVELVKVYEAADHDDRTRSWD